MDFLADNNSAPRAAPKKYQINWLLWLLAGFFLFLFLTALMVWLLAKITGVLPADLESPPASLIVPEFESTSEKSQERILAEKISRPYYGNLGAKLVIVQFSDFQCPFCFQAFPAIREIMNKYQDQSLFIYRHFPIQGENSFLAAEAAECAWEQNLFWQFHDRLFFSSTREISLEKLQAAAQLSGLNLEQFNQCLNFGRYRAQVVEDFEDAVNLGVAGTPTFFINGHRIAGVVTLEQWEKIIQGVLEILE